MMSDLDKTNAMAAEEIESIGSGFVTKYFDALMGKPNPRALRQLFNEQSVYIFAQHGHPDHEMYGMYLIGWFIKRMEYGKCTVSVRSVKTSARPHPTEFAVSSVCELMRPENDIPFKFTQSFVIRRVPWTKTEFWIVETRSKFDVEIEDDYLPEVISVPITCRNIKTAEASHHLPLPVEKFTGVDEKLEESSSNRTDLIFGSKTVSIKKICKRPQAMSTNRYGELKNSGKMSIVCSTTSGSKNVKKTTDNNTNKTSRVYIKSSDVKPTYNNATVSKTKIAENPMTEMESVKNSSKAEAKTVYVVKRNNFKYKMLQNGNKNMHISVNRFESLKVDDETEDSDPIIGDRPVNPSSPSKDTSKGIINRPRKSKCTAKSRKSPTVILSQDDQRITRKMSQEKNDSITSADSTRKSKKRGIKHVAVQSFVRIDSFAKRDESIRRKAGKKMFDTVDEGSKGSSSKNFSAPLPKADLDAQAPDGTQTVVCNGRSKRSRKNRKRQNNHSDDIAPTYIRPAELRIQSIFRQVFQFLSNVTRNYLMW